MVQQQPQLLLPRRAARPWHVRACRTDSSSWLAASRLRAVVASSDITRSSSDRSTATDVLVRFRRASTAHNLVSASACALRAAAATSQTPMTMRRRHSSCGAPPEVHFARDRCSHGFLQFLDVHEAVLELQLEALRGLRAWTTTRRTVSVRGRRRADQCSQRRRRFGPSAARA